jgi:hypothetical protein
MAEPDELTRTRDLSRLCFRGGDARVGDGNVDHNIPRSWEVSQWRTSKLATPSA